MWVVRTEILRAALEDSETRIKLNLASTWEEMKAILEEFTKKKGFQVLEIEEPVKKLLEKKTCL